MAEIKKSGTAGCTLCPRMCGADRRIAKGVCGAGDALYAARADLHYWEEPCISGTSGSGTVFFSGCPMKCVFCQNHEISAEGVGSVITRDRLAELFIMLQDKGAANINLVSPTQYTEHILYALDKVRGKLNVPVVWNTGGYERPETVRRLDGYVDIFLPDLKYISSDKAARYSGAANYPDFAEKAIAEMFRQTGYPTFDGNGMMTKGTLVRHLVLPSNVDESKKVMRYLADTYDTEKLYVSIMRQYFPTYKAQDYPEINRRLTTLEYQRVCDYARACGITHGYTQERSSAKEEYVPPFGTI